MNHLPHLPAAARPRRARPPALAAALVAALALALTACEDQPIPPTTSPLASPIQPGGAAPGTTPLAVTVVPAAQIVVPTPSAERGILTGRVLKINGQAVIPDAPLYLATVTWNSDRTSGIFALEAARAPTTRSQADGGFVFVDVQPGEYVLVVGPESGPQAILSNPDGQARTFEIKPNQVTDLGDARVDY